MFGIIAAAADGTANASAGPWAMMVQFLPLVLIVVVFYFLLIRPQKKKDKAKKEMIAAIGVGDTVSSIGGIMGKITKVKDDEVLLLTGMVGNPNEQCTIRLAKWAVGEVIKKNESNKGFDEPEEIEEDTTEE